MSHDEIKTVTSTSENLAEVWERVTGSDLPGDKRGLDVSTFMNGSEGAGNSTDVPLTSGSTYTGTGEQNGMPQVGVMVKTDQPGTLYFDFSGDGTNWDSSFPVAGFRVSANIPEFHTAVKLGRYFRVRFVNDALGDQTFMRLFTYYGSNFVPSVAPLNQAIGIDTDAQTTRPTIYTDEVQRGLRPGVTSFNKFGYRDGLTAANGEETVWATTGNFVPMTTASTFTITYNNTTDGLGTTGATQLYLYYIDADGLAQILPHTLGNTGSDVTTVTGLGLNRVVVSASGTAQMNTNDITITETTGGTKQAFIPALQSVSQQCIYFTDSNSYAITKILTFHVNKTSGGGNPKVLIKGYVFNRQFETRYEIFRYVMDTQSDTQFTINEPVGFRLSPTDVLYFVADTDTNNTNMTLRFSLLEYKIS